jgi:hypothetical protein
LISVLTIQRQTTQLGFGLGRSISYHRATTIRNLETDPPDSRHPQRGRPILRILNVMGENLLPQRLRIGMNDPSRMRMANLEWTEMSDFEKSFDYHANLAGLPQFADFLDERMDATAVLEYLQEENSSFSGRKEFCEILGIGESTLSGWLKGDRIPKMAKLVIGLLKARGLDRTALEQEEKRVEELKIRDRIVKDGDHYMIVEFASNDGIGRVVARDIPDEASARKLNSRYDYIDLLDRIRSWSPIFGQDEVIDELVEDIEHTLISAGVKLTPIFSSGNLTVEDLSSAESVQEESPDE